MSLRLSASWGQPFTGSDFSMPVDLARGGTGHVHYADTILLRHPAILCMDAPFEIFRPFCQILDVLLVYCRPFCRCDQITLVFSSWCFIINMQNHDIEQVISPSNEILDKISSFLFKSQNHDLNILWKVY
jgi:hypothetical protein